ncbi:uncharacterized protein LOC112268867 [Brachypodium distachyon]|uniref:uncharacterized protein LOC112268867 n=1 Tax=Brachypodium distachyon TaxID=15368 RepID=UPI000D0D6055|nr:uncharacterized protein LOC112268867 [Brachypodium distachyon]|eukprot:XP_024310830.1 uncharacterized protein LOC112268867 [Brachypodium distachyon]
MPMTHSRAKLFQLSNMSRQPSRPPFVVTLLLLVAHLRTSVVAVADEATLQRPPVRAVVAAEAPAAVCCRRTAARAVVEHCTIDIVRSFFGVRGGNRCCRALETVGEECYRATFSGSPFAALYPTVVGNLCGLAAAPT